MNPKKPDEFLASVAEECKVSKKMADDLISFYWKEIRNSLVNYESHNVYAEGIGTFKAKSWKLPEVMDTSRRIIKKYESLIADNKKITIQKFAVLKEHTERLQKLEKLQEMLEKDALKKQEIKQKIHAEKNKNNLDQP